ncbi:phage tail domain-containing protein [Lactiplantibacillus pentosus]|uniref:phage tail domain-containing protein n=1 Tax=Lactiplantibacillus pentosus TaxID=1589 RepID=UPI0013303D7C|nr:phage tail domain-containing protein [Lactiplantibacillus pentosus]
MTLQRDDFEYAGLNSRDDLQVEMGNVVLPSAPAMAEQATDIPAMYGNQFNGTDFTSRTISIPVSIYCADNEDAFNQVMHHLSGLLLSDDPSDNGKEYPLVFGFEPKVTYWGHITAISDPAPINPGMYDMSLTITFVQSDPRATLPQVEKPLNNGLNTITVEGTARTAPVIQVVPQRDLKHIGFTLNGGQYGIGPETPEDQASAVQPYTDVVRDPIASMAMWTNDPSATSVMKTSDNPIYQGSCEINSSSTVMIVANKSGKKDYGKLPSVANDTWYGPAYRYTGMTQSLNDWRVLTSLYHLKYSGQHNGRAMARCELLLLNANGEMIARFGILDLGGGKKPLIRLQLCEPGSHMEKGDGKHRNLYYDYGPSGAFKNKKDKYVRIKTINNNARKFITLINREESDSISDGVFVLDMIKKGQVFTWSITQYNTKTDQPYTDSRKHLVVSGTFVDRKNQFNSPLGGVGAVFLKFPIAEDHNKINYKEPFMSLPNLRIWKANSVNPSDTTYIANAGQEIVLNCETESTTVGGKLVSPIWSTDYPKLKPGVNSLTMTGDLDDAQITLKYIPRLL